MTCNITELKSKYETEKAKLDTKRQGLEEEIKKDKEVLDSSSEKFKDFQDKLSDYKTKFADFQEDVEKPYHTTLVTCQTGLEKEVEQANQTTAIVGGSVAPAGLALGTLGGVYIPKFITWFFLH